MAAGNQLPYIDKVSTDIVEDSEVLNLRAVAGDIDVLIQRIIEFIRSVPCIPLWMALCAALPQDWSGMRVYFGITIILSLIGWTFLARAVRGRFLAMREEEFMLAARFAGASEMRIILRHMVSSFFSHLIASATLAVPAMILSETSLSFLGLGLRPPTISWGVLLQEAQNLRSVALAPWLLLPGVVIIVTILALKFFGDGLRGAADPYHLRIPGSQDSSLALRRGRFPAESPAC